MQNFLNHINVSRETFANRGSDEKSIFRHFRGAASCDCVSNRQHAIASVATGCSHTGMTEHEHVGHEVSQHLGFTHLSFSVGSKEEVDRLTQQMSSDGISIVGQPRTTGDGYYESVVLDPEGNRIEITI